MIEGCDFVQAPMGGQLTNAKHIMRVFGAGVGLVGLTNDEQEIGRWSSKDHDGVARWFFGLGKVPKSGTLPWVPARLRVLILLLRWSLKIDTLGVKRVFCVAPEVLFGCFWWRGYSIAYKFSGIENPLEMPRYRVGRLLAEPFEYALLRLVRRCNAIFAAADEASIARLKEKSRGCLAAYNICFSPTRVDPLKFYRSEAKRLSFKTEKALPQDALTVVWAGRINSVKGWPLIVPIAEQLLSLKVRYRLFVVGDGEDFKALQTAVSDSPARDSISLLGFLDADDLCRVLNGSEVYLATSLREGWPTSCVEALSAGLAVVTSSVSGARSLVIDGVNGYVVGSRDPNEFARRIVDCYSLSQSEKVSMSIAATYLIPSADLHELYREWLIK